MGDFKINEKTVFSQSGSAEPSMGSTVTDIPGAGITGTIGGSTVISTSGAITTTGAFSGGTALIGTGTLNRKLTVVGDGDEPDISLVQLDNTADNYNEIRFMSVGSDDSTYRVGGAIKAIYTGRSGTNPETDLTFWTRVTAGSLTERMRIASSGAITAASSITATSFTTTLGQITASTSNTSTNANTGDAGGTLTFQNTSDTNSNKVGQLMFLASTGLSIARIVGRADDHSGRRGSIVHMVGYGNYPTTKAVLDTGGDWYTNDGSVSSLSDVRIKTDIVDLSDGLDIVNLLKPRTFKFNGLGEMTRDGGEDTTCYGLIADEVLEVAAHYVSLGKGKIDDEEVDDLKSLSMTRMIPMLINAIQELSAKVTALENA